MQGRTTRVPDEGTRGKSVRSPSVTATEGRRDCWRSRRPIGMGDGQEKRTEQGGGGEKGDRLGTSVPKGGVEDRKGGGICGFFIVGLLKIKKVNGEPFKCRFSADDCRLRHIKSLKEVTRSETESALTNAPHEGLNKVTDAATNADKGVFKGE